jgi:UDP-N-acetylmuramoyl-L-alanyl-D-glutamate--2,6-diaminopimelate ligase
MERLIKNFGHLLEAIAANIRYGFPSRRVTVIGVTGTDGKTTTTSLIYHILKSSGKKVAMITSVGAYIGDKRYDIGFHVTTPSAFDVQKYFKKAADEGNDYVVLETTSHALDQYRVWGIHYDIGVLTNITHEHLDYHKTYDEYTSAKRKLLMASKLCILNKDDRESFNRITPFLTGKKIITYGTTDQSALFTPTSFAFTSSLIGDFNKRNILAAIAVTKNLGILDDDIKKAVQTFVPPPGRQEVVYDKDFLVMIDFAHTPNAFLMILPELKDMAKKRKGRLIHVFGSAGLRDATKRPLMGKASSASADIVIVTAEDPRVEKLADINKAILSGINSHFTTKNLEGYKPKAGDTRMVFVIDDRVQAIEFAIKIARKGDIVVTTGKSHETSMNYGSGEVPWDEFAVVKTALRKRNS